MSYSKQEGYQPRSINKLVNEVRQGINNQFQTSYTEQSFLGTNFYKYAYAILQRVQENEIKASEAFFKLQQYIVETNQFIHRPALTPQGIFDAYASEGFLVSVKPMELADAGTLHLCVDLEGTEPNYAELKLRVCELLAQYTAGGVWTIGDQSETIVLGNGQSWTFSYVLPSRIAIVLRAGLTTSHNNLDEKVNLTKFREWLFDNIKSLYRLGLDFEPQRYLNRKDALWTSEVTLEYSLDGGNTWYGNVAHLAYDELYTFEMGDITIVEV